MSNFWKEQNTIAYFKNKKPDWRLGPLCELLGEDVAVADIGCGAGRHTTYLSSKNIAFKACDINTELLQNAINDSVKLNPNFLKNFVQASMVDIPFESNFFDLVISTGVLHQAKNKNEFEKAISEIKRILKSSGILLMNVFTNSVLDESYKNKGGNVFETKEGLDMLLLKPEEILDCFKKEGFILLEKTFLDETVEENTGKRSLIRGIFINL